MRGSFGFINNLLFVILFSALLILIAPNNGLLANDYSYGVESIFSYGASARAMGMGGAFVGISDDASAVYYNPAGISQLEKIELSGLHISLWEGVNYDCLDFVFPTLDYGSFGLGIMRVGVGDIPRRDEYNIRWGSFVFHQEQYFLTYAHHITQYLSVGASGKVSSQTIDSYNASDFSSDLGILFKIPGHRELTIGLNIQNLYSSGLKLDLETEKEPLNIKAGLGYEILFGGYNNRIRLAVDVDKTEQKEANMHFGMETDFGGNFFVRSGYDAGDIVFGAGLSYRFVKLDYAFISSEGIGDVHRFTLSFRFGKPLSMKLRERIAREQVISKERFAVFSRQEKISNANYYLNQGDSLAALSKFEEAQRAYLNALAWKPDFQPAKKRLNDINPEIEMLRYEEKSDLRRTVQEEMIIKRAERLASEGNYKSAIDEIDKLLLIDSNNQQAEALRKSYVSLYQNQIRDLKLKAYSLYKQKEYPEAYGEYQTLSELNPDDPVVRGRINEISNKLQAALHFKRGLQLYNDGNYSLSEVEFKMAFDYDPKDKTSLDYLNRSREKISGTTTLEKLKEDSDIWKLYLDGIKAYQNGDFQSAIKLWRKVLDKYPTNINAIRNIRQAESLMQSQGRR